MDVAILRATREILSERGSIAGLSVDQVAVRAGISKVAIYRRWPDKEALVGAALADGREPIVAPPGVSVRGDLVYVLDTIAPQGDTAHARGTLALAMESERSPAMVERYQREVIEPRRERARDILRRGILTGELRPDIDLDLVVQVLAAPLLYQSQVRRPNQPLPEGLSERVVDLVLRGIAIGGSSW